MDTLDLTVEALRRMNLKVDRRRLLQGGLFAGLNLTALAHFASAHVEPAQAADNAITMWAYPITDNDTEKLWGPLTAKFARQNPGLHVKVTLQPWLNREERMLTAFVSKSLPDVGYLNAEQVIRFSKANMLVALDPYFGHTTLADFPAGALAGCRYNGQLMMIPLLVGPRTSIYNKDLFKKIGADPDNPPGTWDELFKVCSMASVVSEGFV